VYKINHPTIPVLDKNSPNHLLDTRRFQEGRRFQDEDVYYVLKKIPRGKKIPR
jgi:hypothetical protein